MVSVVVCPLLPAFALAFALPRVPCPDDAVEDESLPNPFFFPSAYSILVVNSVASAAMIKTLIVFSFQVYFE